MQVFVLGEARRPGAYTVSSLSTLLNALFASGGPLPQGSLRDIQLLRNGATVVHFDLYDLLLRGDKTHDVPLMPGDVIFIPVVGPQVALAGSVNNPAIYEIRPAHHRKPAPPACRRPHQRRRRYARFGWSASSSTPCAPSSTSRFPRANDPMLADGDIVSVGAILDKYKNAVTLRGNVTAPGRYVWHPGMRVMDLVPNRDQLITRDYYARRNALGNPPPITASPPAARSSCAATATPPTPPTRAAGASNQSSKGGNSLGEALTTSNNVFGATTDLILSGPDLDWSYAVIERLNAETLTTSLIPFNPGALYLHGDQTQNLELLAGDVVTFFSTADIKVPTSQQTRNVRLEGEFVSPAFTPSSPAKPSGTCSRAPAASLQAPTSTAPSSPACPPAASSSNG